MGMGETFMSYKSATPYPNTPDGSFPVEFQNVLDTLEALTYVAAHTNKIALGTSYRYAISQSCSIGKKVCYT